MPQSIKWFWRTAILLFLQPFLLYAATWTSLGPGNIGGRTRALVINNADPDTRYAGSVGGGIWKSSRNISGEIVWQPLDDFMASLVVTAVAIAPGDPNVLYAGTGERYTRTGLTGNRGAGVFKSTNAGVTWSQLSATNNLDFYYINDVVVSPLNSSRVYVTTDKGLWRSFDGGNSWVKSLDVFEGCQDLEMRTDQATDYIFAACGTGILDSTKIYRNIDASGGGSWTSVHSNVNMSMTSIAIAPGNQNVLYALSSERDTNNTFFQGFQGLYRSVNSGDTWTTQLENNGSSTTLNNLLLSESHKALCGSNTLVNRGWYGNTIAVDPVNPDRVWVGGYDLFRSDDAGVNWGLAATNIDESNSGYAPAAFHAIRFHPGYDGLTNQTIFVANDGGIYTSDNALGTVVTGSSAPCLPVTIGIQWNSINKDFVASQFHHGMPYPAGTSYLGGTQTAGTVRGNDTDGVNGWSKILTGYGGFASVDPQNTNIIYAENSNLSLKKSIDAGASFFSIVTGITDSMNNVAPFVLDPNNPQRIWTGGTFMWRSDNGGNTWTQANNGSGSKETTAIAVAPGDSNKVVGGKSSGAIFSTATALTSTSTTSWLSEVVRTGVVSSIAFDPTNTQTLYATYSSYNQRPADSHVYRSTDGGASWIGRDGTSPNKIPDIPVHTIAVHPNNSSILYIGTDLGIFASQDGGLNWNLDNSGFANVSVNHLAFNEVGGILQLYAFTNGRGVWRLNVPNTVLPTVSITSPAGGNVSGTITITADAGSPNGISKVEFYVDSLLIATDFDFPYGTDWDTTLSSNGSHNLTAKAFDVNDAARTSSAVSVNVSNAGPGLFADDFEDGNFTTPLWKVVKGTWSVDAGNLKAVTTTRADIVATPAFPGSSIYTVEADLKIDTAGGRVSLFAWYKDGKNQVELILMDDKNKWLLKQKANGISTSKSVSRTLNSGVTYHVKLSYDGSKFYLEVDGVVLIGNGGVFPSMTPVATPNGTVGFRVKSVTGASVTGRFPQITVY